MKNESPEERAARLQYMRDWRAEKKKSDPDYWKRNYQRHKCDYISRSKRDQHLQMTKYAYYYKGSDAVKESRKKCLQKRLSNGKKNDENNRRRARCGITLAKIHSKRISEFYRKCPPGYQVDHIVPLLGSNICGLHVPWNLQYLTPRDNQKKSNKS